MTRTISDVLPPLSDTGNTCATLVVQKLSSSAMALKAVPPAHTGTNTQFT